jgi:cbb3-type cytochrome oxidase maturation protein
MTALFILIPLGLLIGGSVLWAFLWSLKTGQYDDIEAARWTPFLEKSSLTEDSSSQKVSPHTESSSKIQD